MNPNGRDYEPSLDQQVTERIEQFSQLLKHKLPKILPIVAGVIVLLWLASGVYMVQPGHVGVVRTFGKETARTEPGLQLSASRGRCSRWTWSASSKSVASRSGFAPGSGCRRRR